MNISIGDKISYCEAGRESDYLVDGRLIGEVIAVFNDNEFVIQSRGGQHLCFKNKGDIKCLTTKEFNKLYSVSPVVDLTPAPIVDKPKKIKKKVRPADDLLVYARSTTTKKAKAKVIFEQYSKYGRKAVLDQFVVDLKMTPASASTYYYNFKSGTW